MLSFSPSPEQWGIDPARPAQERYRILGQIAAGGMAEIYLAHMDAGEGAIREVVVKRLRPELQAEEDFVKMFYDEARIASQMNHPNVVRIYELGELDGSLFIGMELVPGVTLRDLLTRLALRRRRLPVPMVLRIACGALEALDYAHRARDLEGRPLHIVHRDVSPQNILISYGGEVKLLDFGVAKAERKFHKTLPGLVKGKFAYMAPEQIRGDNVDARADLFALGETIYEAAVGQHPFQGVNDAAVLAAIMHKIPSEPTKIDPGFPRALGRILMRTLEKDPKLRYSSSDEMRLAIESDIGEEVASMDALSIYLRETFEDAFTQLEQARETPDEHHRLVDALRLQDFAERSEQEAPRQYYEQPTNDLPRTILRKVDDPSETAEPADRRRRTPPRPVSLDSLPIIGRSASEEEDSDDLLPGDNERTETSEIPLLSRPPAFDFSDLEQSSPNTSSLAQLRRVRSTSGIQDHEVSERTERRGTTGEFRPRKLVEPNTGEHDLAAIEREEVERKRSRKQLTKLGRYTILRYWKSSVITESFLAKQEMPFGAERQVVIQRLAPERAQDQAAIDALTRQARLMLRMSHPSVVQLVDFGIHRGEPYIASEWIDGWTLREVFIQCHLLRREIPIGLACRIASGIASALFAMHTATDRDGQIRAIVHRSLTPDAVWISRQGALKISDFGTASEAEADLPPLFMPRGAVYFAPEIGSRVSANDALRADIYSAGVIFFEAVLQQYLTESNATLEELVHLARDGTIDAPLAHDEAKPVALRAIARTPRDRFSSAHALEVDIERMMLRIGQPVTAQHLASWVQRLFSRSSSNPSPRP